MIADVLTKGLGKTKHARFCAALLGHTNPKGGVKEVKNDFRLFPIFDVKVTVRVENVTTIKL